MLYFPCSILAKISAEIGKPRTSNWAATWA